MKIKEVEELFGISKANIRFYEQEGLLSPKRESNGYREYAEEDIETLRTIILFRKLGIPIEQIKRVFTHQTPLQSAIATNITDLEQQIEELNGALKVCREIQKENTELEDFNTRYYWEEISNTEKQGGKFLDACRDYLQFEKLLLHNTFLRPFRYTLTKTKHGVVKAVILVVLFCLCRGIAERFIWQGSFLNGFFQPILIFIAISAIMLPVFLIHRKSPKVGETIISIFLILGLAFFALLFLLIIVLIANAIFHFWF